MASRSNISPRQACYSLLPRNGNQDRPKLEINNENEEIKKQSSLRLKAHQLLQKTHKVNNEMKSHQENSHDKKTETDIGDLISHYNQN